jgi:hypothetical protein
VDEHEMPCRFRLNVRALRIGCEPAHAHVFEHALAQRFDGFLAHWGSCLEVGVRDPRSSRRNARGVIRAQSTWLLDSRPGAGPLAGDLRIEPTGKAGCPNSGNVCRASSGLACCGRQDGEFAQARTREQRLLAEHVLAARVRQEAYSLSVSSIFRSLLPFDDFAAVNRLLKPWAQDAGLMRRNTRAIAAWE